jgi:hypothetical protein
MAENTLEPNQEVLRALEKQSELSARQYEQIVKQINKLSNRGNDMADIMTPTVPMMVGNGDGLFGGAGGGGLIGGLILGSLLRNNGNLFGGDGAVAAAALRNPPEQDQANMSLMQSIGQVDKAVAVGTAAMEASQAAQSASIVSQLNNVASSLATRVDATKEAVNANAMVLAQQLNGVEKSIMENRYELAKDIASDGDKTRALITSQYEATLNRQITDANAKIIALENRADTVQATRGVEVTTTNNINQMQQQQQQQAQYAQLANLIWTLGQQIRSNNEAINVGSGTLTANPVNTNTNIR